MPRGPLGSGPGSADSASVRAADFTDPFAVTCDPTWYVPRPATDAALDAMEAALREGRRCTVLTGPPGIGKTMLLRVLESRMEGSRVSVHLPYAALEFDDLCRWALGILSGADAAASSSPDHELLTEVRISADAGRGLLLFLDDASALCPETARALLRLSDQASGALQLVVVPVDDGRAGRVVAALGADVAHVRLSEPMGAEEVAHYLTDRMRRAGVPEAAASRFDAGTTRRLWRESGGNARLLHAFATAVLRDAGFDPVSPGAAAAAAPPPLDLDDAEVA